MKAEKANAPPKRVRKGIGTMNLILVIVGIMLVLFTVKMIDVYEETGGIPDTLCTCVFTALGGECGVMGWIKTTKERNKDREWLIEDRKERHENIPSDKTYG